jgi:hypothetical protein
LLDLSKKDLFHFHHSEFIKSILFNQLSLKIS